MAHPVHMPQAFAITMRSRRLGGCVVAAIAQEAILATGSRQRIECVLGDGARRLQSLADVFTSEAHKAAA